jgi:hypothetical protein
MRHVKFLTFVFKLIYFFYLTFILLPFAIIGATIIMLWTFIELLINMSILKNTVVSNVSKKSSQPF